jgi:hypothetical protein
MSLDLPQLVPQVAELAQEAAAQADERARRLPGALDGLHRAGEMDSEELSTRIARAGDRWRGALPAGERLAQAFPPPPHPERLHILGADGSQVVPDRHALASFYLLNVGSLHLLHGSGQAPGARSQPSVHFRDDDLYDEHQSLVDPSIVAGRRDAAEMAELARLAETCHGEPGLALLDNALLLWVALQERERARGLVEAILRAYLGHMQRVRDAGLALAGFVDRPGSANVLALVHLAALPIDSITPEALLATPHRGLVDRELFVRLLPPGHRSALFANASPLNRDFGQRGHEVFLFYLNTGYQGQVARVEVPRWVAEDHRRLGWVHAGILEQCRTTGIPYVLVRAHELAVVAQADRLALEEMLRAALAQHGLHPRISQKAETKRWTAHRRRHRL